MNVDEITWKPLNSITLTLNDDNHEILMNEWTAYDILNGRQEWRPKASSPRATLLLCDIQSQRFPWKHFPSWRSSVQVDVSTKRWLRCLPSTRGGFYERVCKANDDEVNDVKDKSKLRTLKRRRKRWKLPSGNSRGFSRLEFHANTLCNKSRIRMARSQTLGWMQSGELPEITELDNFHFYE